MISYIKTDTHITITFDDFETFTIFSNNRNYDKIIEHIKNKEYEEARILCSIKETIINETKDNGNVCILNGNVYYKGEVVHNTLTTRMIDMFNDGFDIKHMLLFLDNLMQNPSRTSVQELYMFLEAGSMPITSDGHFLAYKRVKENYNDIYTNKISNHIGAEIEMPRNKVDEDRNRTCSYGFHFCSRDYLHHYGTSNGNKTVIVKINPKDVVAIPADYKNTKGRCCKYAVVGELEHGNEERLEGTFNSEYDPIYDEDIMSEQEYWGDENDNDDEY